MFSFCNVSELLFHMPEIIQIANAFFSNTKKNRVGVI